MKPTNIIISFRIRCLFLFGFLFFFNNSAFSIEVAPKDTSYADTSKWALTFYDDFEGDALDKTKWNIGYGWGRTTNWTKEYIHDNNVVVENGLLRLIQDSVKYGGKPYTAGAVNTRFRFFQRFGYFEARIKVNNQQGMHFGFWSKSQNDLWPPEIDFMEIVGRQPNRYTNTIHYNDGTANKNDHYANSDPVDYSKEFHVFGCEWNPAYISFFVNGVERKRITDSNKLRHLHKNGQSFYVLLNVHIGNDWSGQPNSTTQWPNYYDIDWVRVYKSTLTTGDERISTQETGKLVINAKSESGSLSGWFQPALSGSWIIAIHDMAGRKVHEEKIIDVTTGHFLLTNLMLKPGMYILKANAPGERVVTGKFIW